MTDTKKIWILLFIWAALNLSEKAVPRAYPLICLAMWFVSFWLVVVVRKGAYSEELKEWLADKKIHIHPDFYRAT